MDKGGMFCKSNTRSGIRPVNWGRYGSRGFPDWVSIYPSFIRTFYERRKVESEDLLKGEGYIIESVVSQDVATLPIKIHS